VRYNTLLITEKGFVFALLTRDQLRIIERAYRANPNIIVMVVLEDDRKVNSLNVLCCYDPIGGISEK